MNKSYFDKIAKDYELSKEQTSKVWEYVKLTYKTIRNDYENRTTPKEDFEFAVAITFDDIEETLKEVDYL